MGRTRQALKCSSRRTNGEPCRAYAIDGGKVCSAHGGRAPQVKAKAARVVAERKAEALLAGISDYEPVTDALGELQRLAGRALRWLDVLEGIVEELQRIRYSSETEQIDGRVIVFERAMDRAGKFLADLARLGIDERMAKLNEAQAQIIGEVIRGVLADIGLSAELREAARPAIARRLRMAAAGERQPVQLALTAAPAEAK